LSESSGLDDRLISVLLKRGIDSEPLLRATLDPVPENLLPPETLPDLPEALERILEAMDRGDKIAVWGHEDADGVSASTLLIRTFRRLRTEVISHIPSKLERGHGLNPEAFPALVEQGVRLIVTVDCCSSNHQEERMARAHGLSVIITDHHELHGLLPDTLLVNPKKGGGSFRYLAGAGVALKLAWGLLRERSGMSLERILEEMPELFVLSTIGTIADRVPHYCENRCIANAGLSLVGRNSMPFADVLRDVKGEVDLDTLISCAAAGQSKNGRNNAVTFFSTDDVLEARSVLRDLLETTRTWQEESERLYERAEERVKRVRNYLLLDLKDTEPQYLGYISNRLRERYGVPTVVLGRKKRNQVVAEVRTQKGVDSLKLLNSLGHLLLNYGGHKQASGFSMEESAIPELVEELERYFKRAKPTKPREFEDISIENPGTEILEDAGKLAKAGVHLRMILKGLRKESPELGLLYDPSGLIERQSTSSRLEIYVSSSNQGLRIQNIFEEKR
jgi:single-stranded-DNA-specific exonuclease